MLVMTRKTNESIIVNDEIEIIILESDYQRVKIGIQAPKTMKIMRKEVIEAVKGENQEALKSELEGLKTIMGQK